MTSSSESTWTVEWFGTTTFRVRQSGLELFFDGYLDRLPGLDPVGLRAEEVERADFVFVSHAHFDHLYGVAPIARSTGAMVVASPESARVLRQDGVPEDQLLMVTGGETVRCGTAASVRVLPALHSCPFAASDYDSAVECLGDLGISAQDRWSKVQGIFAGLRPDVAFLALAGRPNVSREPYQGSSARFMLEQVETLGPGKVCFCHHDPLMPGQPGTDVTEAAALLEARKPGSYFTLEYATAWPLFA